MCDLRIPPGDRSCSNVCAYITYRVYTTSIQPIRGVLRQEVKALNWWLQEIKSVTNFHVAKQPQLLHRNNNMEHGLVMPIGCPFAARQNTGGYRPTERYHRYDSMMLENH